MEQILFTKAKRKYNYTKKTGRPSKLPFINMNMVESLAGAGLTDKQIARVLNVAESTLNEWKKNPEFSESLKIGKLRADIKVVKALYERALGYSHKELVCFHHRGKIITKEVVKYYPPDTTSIIFWLKNRLPNEWREKSQIDRIPEDETYEKYKNLSVDELAIKAIDIFGDRRIADALAKKQITNGTASKVLA